MPMSLPGKVYHLLDRHQLDRGMNPNNRITYIPHTTMAPLDALLSLLYGYVDASI
jgi:hypothetical protein